MRGVKPLFTFYGGKWRAAPHYPDPLHRTIVEPFAGSAGYSMRHHERNVILVDADEIIAGMWSYLISVKPDEVRALPDLEPDQSVDDLEIVQEARWLIGFWLNKGSAQPKKKPSSRMIKSRTRVEPGDPPSSWWGPEIRERIADQVERIRHWKIHGSYDNAPDIEATWLKSSKRDPWR